MGRSCSLTTIQAASNCRINSSCPTHWIESSSGWARCRVTPSISTVMCYPSLCGMLLIIRLTNRGCMARSVGVFSQRAVGLYQQKTDLAVGGVAGGQLERSFAFARRRRGLALFHPQAGRLEVGVARGRLQLQG